MKVSIVVPVYNEEKTIGSCLLSLSKQTTKDCEVIVVDDGSLDKTKQIVVSGQGLAKNIIFLEQNHLGPGAARNLGAKKARGEILVFVDADMEFAPDFVEKLIAPIIEGKTIGTYSSDERLLNTQSAVARCWNLNLGKTAISMEPRDYEKKNKLFTSLSNKYKVLESRDVPTKVSGGRVFRAILRSKFEEVGGFETRIGYTDDWSISRKLGVYSREVTDATYYHSNPDILNEVWKQARWFGKNEFLTKNLIRKIYNLLRYFPLVAPIKGILGTIVFREPDFFLFKIVYDSAVFSSVLLSFFGEEKSK